MLEAAGERVLRGLAAGEDRATRLLLADSRRAYRRAFWCLAAAVLVTLAALIWLGAGRVKLFAPDLAVVLDGGWRLYTGQRPYTDFYCPLGPLPLLVVTMGMWVAGPTCAALNYGYAILFPFGTLWAWVVARRRLPAVQAALFAALVGFLLCALRHLGFWYRWTTYAGHYNRLGWALCSVLLLQLFLPPREKLSARAAMLEGAAAGVVLALLLFTKVNFAAAAVMAVVVAALLFRPRFGAMVAGAAGFAAVALAIFAYLRFDLPALVQDMRMVAGVHKLGHKVHLLLEVTKANAVSLGALAALVLILMRPLYGPAAERAARGWGRVVLAAAAAAGLGLFVNMANNLQVVDITLFAVAALVLSEGFRRRALTEPNGNEHRADARFRYLLGSLLAVCLIGVTLVQDVGSVFYAFAWQQVKGGSMPPRARVDTRTMRDILFPPDFGQEGLNRQQMIDRILEKDPYDLLGAYEYAHWLNDGLSLLGPRVEKDSRVFCMDSKNPFSFALELPCPRGDALFWAYGHVFDEEHCPAPERVLKDVTIIMQPKRPVSRDTLDAMEGLFGPLIHARFEKAAESRLWILYCRRSDNTSGN